MATNRLKLDFALNTNEERTQFLNEYLQTEQFIKKPPTDEELETMGNYILWGKNSKTGLNAKQDGSLIMKTKHGTWDRDGGTESLEELMESPTFNEASLSPLGAVQYKMKREKFSREDALRNCSPALRETFVNLFAQIDRTEMMITIYELAHSKRKNPPREALAKKFTPEQMTELTEKVSHWNQYRYLCMRHHLVEMRREQYTLRDSYRDTLLSTPSCVAEADFVEPDFDAGIEVLPLGVCGGNGISKMVFKPWENLHPGTFDKTDLALISDFYWKKKNYTPTGTQFFVDFRELEHVYEMFNMFFDLENAAGLAEIDSNLPQLMETLKFYIDGADLTELQREILDMKIKKVKNSDIAFEVNKKWGKSYTPNYISTIFRQRIIPRINEAARYHEKVVGNLFFEEEFKVCTGCGRVLLRDAENFTRKTRSKDGFSTRCKKCEKRARTGKED